MEIKDIHIGQKVVYNDETCTVDDEGIALDFRDIPRDIEDGAILGSWDEDADVMRLRLTETFELVGMVNDRLEAKGPTRRYRLAGDRLFLDKDPEAGDDFEEIGKDYVWKMLIRELQR